MSFLLTLALAIFLNGLAAWGAHRKAAVTRDGAAAGFLLGSAIFVGSGLLGWVMLMWFFGSSSLLSRLSTARKEEASRMHEKGSRRDSTQVAANGGIAAVAAIVYGVTGHSAALVAEAAALAAATADTWASEIGALSSHRPRSIVSFRPLPTGTSGGVTLLGTFASLAAGTSMALIFLVGIPGTLFAGSPAGTPTGATLAGEGAAGATLAVWLRLRPWAAAGLIALAGFLGSVVDSILGATLQAQYENSRGELTEKSKGNRLIRGFPVVTNDLVNAVSGALVTGLAAALI